MLDFNETITIVRLCVNAGRGDLIEDALFERKTAADVQAMIGATLESDRAAWPAARPAASRSIFGEPTPAERDKLALALQRRFEQIYPKRAS